MITENNRTSFMSGGFAIPSITVNINLGEQPIRRRRRAISIDGIDFCSFDDAVSYLVNDGMTPRQALNFLSRGEVY